MTTTTRKHGLVAGLVCVCATLFAVWPDHTTAVLRLIDGLA